MVVVFLVAVIGQVSEHHRNTNMGRSGPQKVSTDTRIHTSNTDRTDERIPWNFSHHTLHHSPKRTAAHTGGKQLVLDWIPMRLTAEFIKKQVHYSQKSATSYSTQGKRLLFLAWLTPLSCSHQHIQRDITSHSYSNSAQHKSDISLHIKQGCVFMSDQ